MADLEQLTVTLNAKIDQFKAGMNQAVKEFETSAGAIDEKNKQLTKSVEKNMKETAASANFLASAFKQLVTIAVFEKLASGILKANENLVQMAKTADLVGVSVKHLQEIQFAAKTLGGADPDDVNKGVRDLTLAANREAREGEGQLTRLLEANNEKLTDRTGKVKSTNDLLEIAARLIQNAASEADKIDIAQAFHLPESLIPALEKGTKAFKDAQTEASKAGAIIKDEVVERAKQFDAAWNQSWSNFGTKAKSAAVEAAGGLRQMYEAAKDKAGFEADPTVLGQIAEQHRKAGQDDMAAYFQGRAEAQARNALARKMAPAPYDKPAGPDQNEFGPRDVRPGGGGASGLSGPTGGGTLGIEKKTVVPAKPDKGGDTTNDFERAYNSLLKQNEGLRAQAEAEGLVGKAIDEKVAFEKISQAAQEAGIKLTRQDIEDTHKLAAEYANLKENLAKIKLERDIQFGYSQLGRTKEEAAAFAEVRGKGIDPDSDVGKEQVRNLERLHDLTEAKDTAGSFIKGMISDMQNGVRAGQALENQLKRIADKLLDKTLDSALSGLFKAGGGLFGLGGSNYGASDYASAAASAAPGSYGPGFASGGIVGRDGEPTFIPAPAWRGAKAFASGGGVGALVHEGELILNRAQQKNVLSSMQGNGPINLTHAPVIQGVGLSQEQLMAVLTRNNKDFERRIGPIFGDWNRRYGNQFDR
jgi:hypothetical protein